jgi:hypothetical protein
VGEIGGRLAEDLAVRAQLNVLLAEPLQFLQLRLG